MLADYLFRSETAAVAQDREQAKRAEGQCPRARLGHGLADDGGNAYLSTRGGYFVVDLSAGHVARVDVSGAPNVDFTAIARRAVSTARTPSVASA